MIWRAVTLISCGIVGGWLGFMASDREVPTRYYKNEALNSPRPGEVLRIRHTLWRDRSCATTVYQLVFDDGDRRYTVPEMEFAAGVLPVGKDVVVVPIPISLEASPGPARYRIVRRYKCNILHSIWPIEDGPHDVSFIIAS